MQRLFPYRYFQIAIAREVGAAHAALGARWRPPLVHKDVSVLPSSPRGTCRIAVITATFSEISAHILHLHHYHYPCVHS